jgi:hypothetical protein
LIQLSDVQTVKMSEWNHFREKPADCGEPQKLYNGEGIGKTNYSEELAEDEGWREMGCDLIQRLAYYRSFLLVYDKCIKLHDMVDKSVFGAVTASIRAARSTVPNLDVLYIAERGFGWADDGQLVGLGLSHLHQLRFHPVVEVDHQKMARLLDRQHFRLRGG